MTKSDSNRPVCLAHPPQIRAYTGGDKFSETAWSQPISTDPDNTAILVSTPTPP